MKVVEKRTKKRLNNFKKMTSAIVIIVFLLLTTVFLAKEMFAKKLKKQVNELLSSTNFIDQKRDTTLIDELPVPVQSYFNYLEIVGKASVKSVALKQEGLFKRSRDQKYMPFTAEQYFITQPTGFVWVASFGGLMNVCDSYKEGKGKMKAKIVGLVGVGEAQGYKLDQGALLRYFSEMIWFPEAYLNTNIKWKAIDEFNFTGVLTDNGLEVTGYFQIDEKGALKQFSAYRYMDIGNGEFRMEKWVIEVKNYQKINGMMIPLEGAASWKLKDGDFKYIELEIKDIKLNPKKAF